MFNFVVWSKKLLQSTASKVHMTLHLCLCVSLSNISPDTPCVSHLADRQFWSESQSYFP